MILMGMLKPISCKCGRLMDARAKTGMCRKCFRKCQKQNRKPDFGGSQFKDSSGKTHYQRNKEYYYERVRERKKRLREFITNYKKQHPCVDCGNLDERVLTFDHISDDKEIDVSKCLAQGWSEKRILSEIQKCEVRCFNCHMIITLQRKKYFLCDTGV